MTRRAEPWQDNGSAGQVHCKRTDISEDGRTAVLLRETKPRRILRAGQAGAGGTYAISGCGEFSGQRPGV